ncbi:MAG: RraA family protein [Armatimonadetes bacterium]|nr:RraA family protein [Armatimonadota bacterium]
MAEVNSSVSEMCERFLKVYTGAITDVLDEMGYHHQTLPHYLQPLAKGSKLAGLAFPVFGRPNRRIDYETSIRRILTMLGDVPINSVVIYQTNDLESAHLGELSVTWLKQVGCRGAVIDGGCRDIEYILREEFPVFCRFTTPEDCCWRWELMDYNCPIIIGDVTIRPGDFIVADFDGIVCIPKDISFEVLLKSEEIVNTENLVRKAIREGMKPLDAYEKFGRF